ncbi:MULTISPECIES: DUF2341 domain-containing protein [unclassified Sphingobium]|uniref:DUF2341 domain-containing protein n=1 Tax=unclassified Sphingobium TaxID=2611147 RepID=UPI0035A68DF0
MRIGSWLAALMLSMAVAAPAMAEGGWWEKDWPYRKVVTLDTTASGMNVPGAVGRSLVLVRLHSGNFGFSDSLDNGADLRFTAADDKTPLPFHIEKYDAQNQIAIIWVSVPNLNGGEKQDIHLYYGNKNAPVGQDIAGSFDADYAAVYHFSDNPGQPVSDATANKNNSQAAPAGVNDAAIIARGGRFPGNVPLTIADSPSLAIPAGSGFTFSAWVKPDQLPEQATIYGRGGLTIALMAGVPTVVAGGAQLRANAALKQGDWSHLALAADGKTVRLYVNGVEAGAASAALPAQAGPIALGAGFVGEMDEVRISKVGRSPGAILVDAKNEGPGDKLVTFGADEKQGGGHSPMLTIVQNTPFDAWVVIAILMVMLVIAIWVMYAKSAYLRLAMKANAAFMKRFRRLDDLVPFDRIEGIDAKERALIEKAPLKALYDVGMEELEHRKGMQIKKKGLSAETIEAMRASVDAEQVFQNEKLDKWMVLLTIAISGGPFIGLLGTVLGVMLVFGEVAAAGDVNINAIAPGIAAALLATVAGLGVAIPSLFGYNYLNAQVVTIANEMRVFVDRLITRLAETHHHMNPPQQPLSGDLPQAAE